MDPRSMRSRQLLRDALASTLDKLPFEHITVVLLTKRAGVNRSTFYQHYATPDDLLIDLVNSRLDDTGLSEVDPRELDMRSDDIPDFVSKLMGFIERARPAYVSQLSSAARNTVSMQFCDHLTTIFYHVTRTKTPHASERMMMINAAALAGALTGVFSSWLKSEDPMQPADLEAWVWRMIRLSLLAVERREMTGDSRPSPITI